MRYLLTIKHILFIAIIFNSLNIFAQENTPISMTKINENQFETDKIFLSDNPQKKYTLELKEGKPFNGYQISEEKLLGEFHFVNQYENGNLVARYSVDYIAKDQYEAPIEYTLKTTFSDGKIISGNDYKILNQQMLLTDKYQKGKIVSFDLDLFDMHYFNRITFKLDNDIIIVKSFQTKEEIRIYKEKENLKADLYADNKLVKKSGVLVIFTEPKAPNSSTVYYWKDNKLNQTSLIINNRTSVPEVEDQIILSLFMQFGFRFESGINDFFQKVNEKMKHTDYEEANEIASIFLDMIIPYTEEGIKGHLTYDEKGNIADGSEVIEMKEGKYKAIYYQQGKLTKEEVINDINKFSMN